MSHRPPTSIGLRRLAGPVVLSFLCAALAAKENDGAADAARPPDQVKQTVSDAKQKAEQLAQATMEAQGLVRLGAKLTDRGDYPSAEVAYRQILDRPEFSVEDQKPALLGLARMYRKSNNLTKSAAIYEKFIKEFPDESRVPDVLLDLGRTLRDMGAYKLALSRFYSVINSTLKVDAQAFDHYQQLAKTAEYEIAETYYESAQFADAGKYFTRLQLLDLGPADRARALFMAAHSQLLAGDNDNAVRTLRSFLDQWPTDENVPEARFLLATTLRDMKRPQEALEITLDLLRNAQTKAGADGRALAYWQRRTGNMLANDFFQNGDTMSALTIYNRLIAMDTNPAWALPVSYQIGLCYERLRLVTKARDAYQRIIDAATVKPGDPAPNPEIVELAQMASWRLNYISWLDQTAVRLTTIETSGVVPLPTRVVSASARGKPVHAGAPQAPGGCVNRTQAHAFGATRRCIDRTSLGTVR
jgi:tetratricopeptide (TPR) repeat protein